MTLHQENGAGTRTIKGAVYRALMKKGLFTTVLGNSMATSGARARWYVFTDLGLELAQELSRGPFDDTRNEYGPGYMQGRGAA